MGPARINKGINEGFDKEKSFILFWKIKYRIKNANGRINKLSINKPTSASILIFFLNKLYELHNNATKKPIQGKVEISINKYREAINTIINEIILFLFNFSLKKIYPKKTLNIGNMK